MTRLPREDPAAIVADVGPFWSGLRGARMFLTGGTGFFGTRLVESFLAATAPGTRYVPDVSLAAASLGLRPRIPLDEALRRTARHARIS